jgi:hypothetical protein
LSTRSLRPPLLLPVCPLGLQGEEADVVVVSLVRSNPDRQVGFLREPERVNVLLSRARHGMILFGDSDTLRHARSTDARRVWGRVLADLEGCGAVLAGLPVCCQAHGTQALLRTPADFAEKAPCGGCARPCHARLPCGHACTLRCHAFDREHTQVACAEEVVDVCERGHPITRRCGLEEKKPGGQKSCWAALACSAACHRSSVWCRSSGTMAGVCVAGTVPRRCSQAAADTVCGICVEVRKVEAEERRRGAELVRGGANVRPGGCS